jgi:hypothetical protein
MTSAEDGGLGYPTRFSTAARTTPKTVLDIQVPHPRPKSSPRQYLALDNLLHEAKFGAYTELYAGLSSEITLEKNGAYIIPWGRTQNRVGYPSPPSSAEVIAATISRLGQSLSGRILPGSPLCKARASLLHVSKFTILR